MNVTGDRAVVCSVDIESIWFSSEVFLFSVKLPLSNLNFSVEKKPFQGGQSDLVFNRHDRGYHSRPTNSKVYGRFDTKSFRDRFDTNWIDSVDSIQLNLQARSRGRSKGARAPPEIFRFELNSATKVEFCLLKWTAVHGSYSFQVLSITVRLCTVVLLCNWNCVKERNRIFALPKTTKSFKICVYFSSK